MRLIKQQKFVVIVAAVGIAAGVLGWNRWSQQQLSASRQPTGLFSTLPILWAEADSMKGLLNQADEPHWAKAVIAGSGGIVPLDTLAAPGQTGSLAGPLDGLKQLVIAQPRPLSPDENVALDRWVRAGGRVLLLADPALTEPSGFAIGDRRRPQSSVLLSPILKRWGIDLVFDESQVLAEQAVQFGDLKIPVVLPGQFALLDPGACQLKADGVIAVCAVSNGQVVAVADAAVLDRTDPSDSRAAALRGLLDAAFQPR